MTEQCVNDQYYITSRTFQTVRNFECKQFKVFLEMKSAVYTLDSDIEGHIVLQARERMPNRDFLVQLFGKCVYYSQNPFKQPMKTEESSLGHEESMMSILHRNNCAFSSTATPRTVQTFLEGSQLLRYANVVEDTGVPNEGTASNIEYLEPGRYYLPFSLHLPNRIPPSIGLLNFEPLHFSIQYEIKLEDYISQEIKLVESNFEDQKEIQQLCTNVIEFDVRKYCFRCLGRYRIEVTLTLHDHAFRIKLLYFQVGVKGSELHLSNLKIRLMARVLTVGEHLVSEKQCQLHKLQYNLFGCELVMDLQSTLRSFQNELFTLDYYIQVLLQPSKFISLSKKQEQRHMIPL